METELLTTAQLRALAAIIDQGIRSKVDDSWLGALGNMTGGVTSFTTAAGDSTFSLDTLNDMMRRFDECDEDRAAREAEESMHANPAWGAF